MSEDAAGFLDVRSCARCGKDHEGLKLLSLFNPTDEFTHWAVCPDTGQPILVGISSPDAYDSALETHKHIDLVATFLLAMGKRFFHRAAVHDASKLLEPEKSVYDKFTPMLAGLTYGSPEYKQCLVDMGPALEHHYQNNSHHPEHYKMWRCPVCMSVFHEDEAPLSGAFENVRLCPICCENGTIMECSLVPVTGIYGMSLLDIFEMLADWNAATKRHDDGDLKNSLVINRLRFQIDDQLFYILKNTVAEMGW